MKRYHVYGKYYNWTTNKRTAFRWAKQWNGTVTIEINGIETILKENKNA